MTFPGPDFLLPGTFNWKLQFPRTCHFVPPPPPPPPSSPCDSCEHGCGVSFPTSSYWFRPSIEVNYFRADGRRGTFSKDGQTFSSLGAAIVELPLLLPQTPCSNRCFLSAAAPPNAHHETSIAPRTCDLRQWTTWNASLGASPFLPLSLPPLVCTERLLHQ